MYRSVEYPLLRETFGNISDERCNEIVEQHSRQRKLRKQLDKARRRVDLAGDYEELIAATNELDAVRRRLDAERTPKATGKERKRQRAFQLLHEAIIPEHMRNDRDKQAPKAKPIPKLKPETARGIVWAVESGLVTHAQWLRLYQRYEGIEASAELEGD